MLFHEFAAARKRDERQHDRDARLAWMTQALARTKRLPRLETLLLAQADRTVRRDGQSLAAMKATMHALAAAHGFKFTPGTTPAGA